MQEVTNPIEQKKLVGEKSVQIFERNVVYNGFFKMLKYKLRHTLFGGGMSDEFYREVMIRPDAVAVILYDPERDVVVLVKQFRVGAIESSDPWLIEPVAGIVEPGEALEEVAIREAEEETGLEISQPLTKIGEFYGSPGGLSEKTTLFYAEVDSSKADDISGLDSENEDILVVVKPTGTLFREIEEGLPTSASLLIASQWLKSKITL